MRISFLVASLILATIAHAAPLDQLSSEQKNALGELFGGYSESFLCHKEVDYGLAGRFLKSTLKVDSISPEQAAQLANAAIGIHLAMMARFQKEHPLPAQKDEAEKVIKDHCAQVERAFGPHGELVPGLLK